MDIEESPEVGDGQISADEVLAIIARAVEAAHTRVDAPYFEAEGEAAMTMWTLSGQRFRIEVRELS